MIIGIDVDEVLADHLSSVMMFHNERYGTKLRRSQFKSYKFWETWGGTREETIHKIHEFYKTPYFKNEQPIEGSKRAISLLKSRHELVVITSRQDIIAKETKAWIARIFPGSFNKVIFTNSYSKNGRIRKKSDVCRRMNVDILIEDSLDHALDCLIHPRKILLLDNPWNQSSKLPKGIIRVRSWKEITEFLTPRKSNL